MAKRDLMDYLAAEKHEEKEEAGPPAEKPDLASKRLMYLAEETGVSDPAALVKLVKACCEQYREGPASEEG
ncbi:MAG TPA: hypothetical protein VJ140_19620 [Actinomycetota bacterium]|nr:hypothetical protein [Actinomycetota bacterium]